MFREATERGDDPDPVQRPFGIHQAGIRAGIGQYP